MLRKPLPLLMTFLCVLVMAQTALTQSTEFTFQGRLLDNSLPATGSYDLEFRLFDAATGGTELGLVIAPGVSVTSGVFSVPLDFGSSFDGGPRFIQIGVKPAGSPDPFTVLDPRQPISSTPYAIRSLNAAAAETAANSSQLGGVDAAEYVQDDDQRLTDARSPTAGSGNYIQNQNVGGQIANFNINGRGEANVFSASMQYDLGGLRILSSPGTLNTFVGINNGLAVTSGERNTFVGRNTGVNTTTGSTNTFVGSGAGYENISGSQNSFFGYNAGLRVTGGSRNSYFGVSVGGANLIGVDNAMFGYESGLNATGSGNSFFGSTAGRNTTGGINNSFFGRRTGMQNTAGGHNVFLGALSGEFNTVGNSNTFIGAFSGNQNLSGAQNTVLGYGADVGSTDLTYATAIGAGSVVPTSNTIQLGRSNGDDRVLIPGNLQVNGNITGGGSLSFIRNQSSPIQSGNFNISASGEANTFNARSGIEIASELVLLRSVNDIWLQNLLSTGGIDFRSEAAVSALYISPNSLVRVRLATGGVSSLCINADYLAACGSSIRYKDNISAFSHGRDIIRLLRPVSFTWKSGGLHDLGLVAEEVAEIEPLLVTYNKDGEVEGVKYDRIGVVLINVVKEQQEQIEAQQRQIEALKAIVCELKPGSAACK